MFGAACAPKVLVCVCVCVCRIVGNNCDLVAGPRVCAFAADLSLLERADRWRCDKKIVGAHVTCVCAV